MSTTSVALQQPYKEESLNEIYELLFCDNVELYKTATSSTQYPWDILLSDHFVEDKIEKVAADRSLESRQRLLAYHILSLLGKAVTEKELLAVIVEVGMPEGLDVLAAFGDGTARYINYSGKLLVWETKTAESNKLIEELYSSSINVVNKIGRWDGERRPFPKNGTIRLNFLLSDGLYFGEGPFEVLLQDPMGGPVIDAATQLMTYLTGFKAR